MNYRLNEVIDALENCIFNAPKTYLKLIFINFMKTCTKYYTESFAF